MHERWREIGPVYPDKKEEIWQRFKEATNKIHKNHQEFFKRKREEEENNLKAKTILCEIAEEIAGKAYLRYKDWEEATSNLSIYNSDGKLLEWSLVQKMLLFINDSDLHSTSFLLIKKNTTNSEQKKKIATCN